MFGGFRSSPFVSTLLWVPVNCIILETFPVNAVPFRFVQTTSVGKVLQRRTAFLTQTELCRAVAPRLYLIHTVMYYIIYEFRVYSGCEGVDPCLDNDVGLYRPAFWTMHEVEGNGMGTLDTQTVCWYKTKQGGVFWDSVYGYAFDCHSLKFRFIEQNVTNIYNHCFAADLLFIEQNVTNRYNHCFTVNLLLRFVCSRISQGLKH